jgi:membrane protein
MKLGGTFLALLAIRSANGGVKAIIDALNVFYHEKEKRGFLKLNAISLGFTAAGVVVILTAIGLVGTAPVILSMIGLAIHGRPPKPLGSRGVEMAGTLDASQ